MTEIFPLSRRNIGMRILLVGAAAALAIAIFNFLWRGNGIHGTAGALLVVISSALMVAASCALVFFDSLGRGWRGALIALIALDIVGTGLAAYFLEAVWLIVAMAVALIGWLLHLVSGPTSRQSPRNSMVQKGAE
jgi:hypothetical protein